MDLSAAHGLKAVGDRTFSLCKGLRFVLLNDGLETIDNNCFEKSGLEEVTIPNSVESIGKRAFCENHLKRVRFLGATGMSHTDSE